MQLRRRADIFVLPFACALLLAACSGGGSGAVAPIASSVSPGASATPTVGASASPGGVTPTPTAGASATPTARATATPNATATPSPSPTATQAALAGDWPLFGRDSARSGVSGDVAATPHPGTTVTLTKLWQDPLGVADAAPVVNGSTLYITLDSGTTYAINTATGATLWTFTASGSASKTTAGPAYDVAGRKLYVPSLDSKMHRLDPVTGLEDSSGGFPITLSIAPKTEKDSSPYNIANGYVYAQVSAYFGDAPPYVGHAVAVNTASGSTNVFNALCSNRTGLIDPTSCSQSGGGMWSREGIVVDPDGAMGGRIYGSTGNGLYDPANHHYGDTALALAADGSALLDHFTPSNSQQLSNADLDIGSTAPALIPRQNGATVPLVAVQGGKDGVLRLLDRTNLNGAGALLQSVSLPNLVVSSPAVYTTAAGQTYVYVGISNGIYAYQVGLQGGVPHLSGIWTSSDSLGGSGTSPVVRAGVLYAAGKNQLLAYDAISGVKLGSSNLLGDVHWQSPIVTGGVVYCSDTKGNLFAFTIQQT